MKRFRHRWVVLLLLGCIGIYAASERWASIDHVKQVIHQQLGKVIPLYLVRDHQGHLRVQALYLQSQWHNIPSSLIYPRLQCQQWLAGDHAVVTGVLKSSKKGGAWNRFQEGRLFDQVNIRLSCLGVAHLTPPPTSWFEQGFASLRTNINGLQNQFIQQAQSLCKDQWSCNLIITLLTGQKQFLSHEMKQILQKSFLWHLFVISGMHVIWVFAVFQMLWKLLTLPLRVRFGNMGIQLDQLGLYSYCFLFPCWFGFTASTVRALVFYLGYRFVPRSLLGQGTTFSGISIQLLMGMLLMIVYPMYMLQIGFWMSWYASIGIRLLSQYPLFKKKSVGWAALFICMNLWMLPWILFLTGEVLWLFIFVSPLMCLLLSGLGIVQLVMSLAWPHHGMLSWLEQIPSKGLAWIMHLPSECYWVQPLHETTLWFVCCAWLCLLLAFLHFQKPVRDLS